MPLTSLSIVLGTPTTGSPFSTAGARSEGAVAADRDQRVESAGLEGRDQIVGAIDLLLVAVRVAMT